VRAFDDNMTPVQQQQIVVAHSALPQGCRCAPASEEALAAFEVQFGPVPPDYRWYLAVCGGGVIGSEWIACIKELPETHRRVREGQQNEFYTLLDFFPVGWDGGGNPYGFDLQSGRIVIEDHDFGGIHEVAENFYALLAKKGLLK
jgi:hypothetical protein